MQRGLHLVDGTAKSAEETSIVAVERFIHATRDSGYRGTAAAICELVDNALQASLLPRDEALRVLRNFQE